MRNRGKSSPGTRSESAAPFSDARFMSGVFLHGRSHAASRVFRRQTRAIHSHLLNFLPILHQLANPAREEFARELRFLEKNRCVNVGIDFCIAGLMIVSGIGKWDQDAR